MTYGIRIAHLSRAVLVAATAAGAHLRIGEWIAEYDPDRSGGAGWATSTPDAGKALAFPTVEAAVECWRQRSTVCPWRADGQPNRPPTAISVEIDPLPEATA